MHVELCASPGGLRGVTLVKDPSTTSFTFAVELAFRHRAPMKP
jgi:hypothetical protein